MKRKHAVLQTLCGIEREQEFLDLSEQGLAAGDGMLLADELGVHRHLLDLDLSGNQICHGDSGVSNYIGIATLCTALQSNEILQLLDLSHNELQSEGTWHLARLVRENESLTWLNISEVDVVSMSLEDLEYDYKGVDELGDALMQNESIQTCILKDTSLPIQQLKGHDRFFGLEAEEEEEEEEEEVGEVGEEEEDGEDELDPSEALMSVDENSFMAEVMTRGSLVEDVIFEEDEEDEDEEHDSVEEIAEPVNYAVAAGIKGAEDLFKGAESMLTSAVGAAALIGRWTEDAGVTLAKRTSDPPNEEDRAGENVYLSGDSSEEEGGGENVYLSGDSSAEGKEEEEVEEDDGISVSVGVDNAGSSEEGEGGVGSEQWSMLTGFQQPLAGSESAAPAPATNSAAPAPATDSAAPAPATDSAAPAPATNSAAPAPATNSAAPAPATDSAAPAPATDSAAPAHATDESTDTTPSGWAKLKDPTTGAYYWYQPEQAAIWVDPTDPDTAPDGRDGWQGDRQADSVAATVTRKSSRARAVSTDRTSMQNMACKNFEPHRFDAHRCQHCNMAYELHIKQAPKWPSAGEVVHGSVGGPTMAAGGQYEEQSMQETDGAGNALEQMAAAAKADEAEVEGNQAAMKEWFAKDFENQIIRWILANPTLTSTEEFGSADAAYARFLADVFPENENDHRVSGPEWRGVFDRLLQSHHDAETGDGEQLNEHTIAAEPPLSPPSAPLSMFPTATESKPPTASRPSTGGRGGSKRMSRMKLKQASAKRASRVRMTSDFDEFSGSGNGELPATPRTQSRMFGVDRVSIKNVETTGEAAEATEAAEKAVAKKKLGFFNKLGKKTSVLSRKKLKEKGNAEGEKIQVEEAEDAVAIDVNPEMHIHSLSLSGSRLAKDDALVIGRLLRLSTLTSLDLSYCPDIEAEGTEVLTTAIKRSVFLVSVNLLGNHVRPEQAEVLMRIQRTRVPPLRTLCGIDDRAPYEPYHEDMDIATGAAAKAAEAAAAKDMGAVQEGHEPTRELRCAGRGLGHGCAMLLANELRSNAHLHIIDIADNHCTSQGMDGILVALKEMLKQREQAHEVPNKNALVHRKYLQFIDIRCSEIWPKTRCDLKTSRTHMHFAHMRSHMRSHMHSHMHSHVRSHMLAHTRFLTFPLQPRLRRAL
jgi:hypothetical protein